MKRRTPKRPVRCDIDRCGAVIPNPCSMSMPPLRVCQEHAKAVVVEGADIRFVLMRYTADGVRVDRQRDVIDAALVVSTDLAQDCLEDPIGWHNRETEGWRRLSVSAANKLRDALAALASPGQPGVGRPTIAASKPIPPKARAVQRIDL